MGKPLSPIANDLAGAVCLIAYPERPSFNVPGQSWDDPRPRPLPCDACRAAAADIARRLADQVLPAASPRDRATWSPFAAQIRSEILTIADDLAAGTEFPANTGEA